MEKFKKKPGAWRLESVIRRYFHLYVRSSHPLKFANSLLTFYYMLAGKAHLTSKPFVLRVEPTNICNLHCPKCACGVGTDPRPRGYMDFERFNRLIDSMKDHSFFVRLDGLGEPMLHPRINDFIRYSKQSGLSVAISSNLHILPEGAEALVRTGLDHLIIAFDGISKETYERYRTGGNFEKVRKNLSEIISIKKKLNSNLRIETQYLKFDFNQIDQEDYFRFTDKLGVDKATIIDIMGRKPRKAVQGKPKRCFWLWCVLTVGWAGETHLCGNSFTYAYPEINIFEEGFDKFWSSERMICARNFNVNTFHKTDGTFSHEFRCSQCREMLVVDDDEEYKQNYICT